MNENKRGGRVLRAIKFALLVIATASLAKIAFFPAGDDTRAAGGGDFAPPTTTLEMNPINNETQLSATVLRDAPTTIRATASGQVSTVFIGSGQPVNAGQALIQVTSTTAPAAAATDGDEDAQAAPPVVQYRDIAATAGGTVDLTVVVGKTIEAGQEIGTISPNSFHAIAQPKTGQLYAMGDVLRSGRLSITDGPGPFQCDEVKIVTAPSPASVASGDAGAAAGSGGGPQIRCEIPDSQTAYEGIQATLTIGGNTSGEVTTLPVSAVEGRFHEGIVYLPSPEPGKPPIKRKVQLGPYDGTNIEIKGGLRRGEEVLMFVPARQTSESNDSGDGGDAGAADADAADANATEAGTDGTGTDADAGDSADAPTGN